MSRSKDATHQVVKSGCYFTPGGKELEVGSQMTLSAKQAEQLEKRGIVRSLKDSLVIDVSDAESKELEQVKATLKTVSSQLHHTQIELDAVKKQVKKESE